MANHVVEFAGWHMHSDEPFPLEVVPSRVRHALLSEFKGRCPSVREVDQIPDKHLLTAPGIGPTTLQTIRSVTNAARKQEGSGIDSQGLSDVELLSRLEGLQEDLRWLEAHVKAQMLTDSRRRTHRRRRNHATRNQTGHLSPWDGWTESSQHPSGQDHVA